MRLNWRESSLNGSTYIITCRYLPPKGGRDLRALHHRDLIANRELREIVKLRFVEALALHRDQADRQAGGVELQHHRRKRSGRQALQIGQREIGKLGDVGVGVGARLEIRP